MQRQRFNSPFYKKYAPLRYPPKIVSHTTLPTTILLFQNLFSSKINSQSPILPYLRQRYRSSKSKTIPHTILPTTILLFQNLFSSKNNSQSPILPYLRHRSRPTKSKIVLHTTLHTTILLLQNLFSLSNHNLLIFISIPCTFYIYQYSSYINTYLCYFFFKNSIFRKLFYF